MTYFFTILLSILFGMALGFTTITTENSKYKQLTVISDLIFAGACLLTITFSTDIWELNEHIEKLCYVILLIVFLVTPKLTRFSIAKFSKNDE